MALPQSVQQAADYADAVEKKILGGGEEQPTEPVPAAVTEKPVATVEENPTDELKKYQERYNSLRGKYNAEVPRLNDEVKALREQIAQLQEERRAAKEASAQQESEMNFITDDDADTFGADMVDMSKRAAREVTKEQVRRTARLENEIEILKSQIGAAKQVAEESAKNKVERDIASICPNWKEYDTTEEFRTWVHEEDPNYGAPRWLAFHHAAQAGDGIRVGKIFKMYEDSLRTRVDPLAKQVTPDHRAAAPAVKQNRRWKESDIVKFYQNARAGRIPADTVEKIEQEINEAVANGNVLMGM